jgi:predicted PhzF superfamily epimerase YddE/YHI9
MQSSKTTIIQVQDMKYYIVDAFTDQPFGGTAAVVAEGELLTE